MFGGIGDAPGQARRGPGRGAARVGEVLPGRSGGARSGWGDWLGLRVGGGWRESDGGEGPAIAWAGFFGRVGAEGWGWAGEEGETGEGREVRPDEEGEGVECETFEKGEQAVEARDGGGHVGGGVVLLR